jgi:hypothetical protein
MNAFQKLTQLHDYVKKNYEQGNYDGAKESWSTESVRAGQATTEPMSDYQMGFDQAVKDHEQHRAFHHYPSELVKLGNAVSDHKLAELSEFINGYNAAKKHVQEQ